MPHALVTIDDDGALRLNEEALQELAGVEGHLAVVAGTGLYRSGKSFLLNELGGADEGFNVGHSTAACTRGLWLLGPPKQVTLPSGEELSVIFIDSEGFGATDKTSYYDSRILALCTLLSSCLLYNSSGSIDERSISNLAFIANLTRQIRVRQEDGDEGDEGDEGEEGEEEEEDHAQSMEFASFFPSFRWVLRDFSLELVDDEGHELTPQQYMEASLRTQPGFDAATNERNRVRHMLTGFFRDRDCYTLVRPVEDEDKLQHLDSLPRDEFRPQFLEELERLRQQLLSSLSPKSYQGVPLNGAMWAALCRSYVGAVNGGGVPVVQDAWAAAVSTQCRSALRLGLQAYRAALPAPAEPLDEAALGALHAAAHRAAVVAFVGAALGDSVEQFRTELEEALAAEWRRVQEANWGRSDGACRREFDRLYRASAAAAPDSVEAFAEAWRALREEYFSAATGPAAAAVFNEASAGKLDDALRVLALRVGAARNAAETESTQREAASRLALVEAESRAALLQGRVDAFQEQVIALENKLSAAAAAEGLLETASQELARLKGEVQAAGEFEQRAARAEAQVRLWQVGLAVLVVLAGVFVSLVSSSSSSSSSSTQ